MTSRELAAESRAAMDGLVQSREFAVETRKLTKRYGLGPPAVDKLSLKVRRGGIYGFLGPNGSGKTTTLKMLLGLVEPTSGTAWVLGEAPGTFGGLAQVGAMIESPGFYPYLSGLGNLKIVARYAGVPVSQVEEMLGRVGLKGRAKDKFKSYSLGMKQRLGVAAALLKNPELLILDEPTNGLDAKGMSEMRGLIRRLGVEGRTVLLSSHLMWEVEQLCDRVGVIQNGRLVAEGETADLKRQGGLEIKAEPLEKASEIVASMDGVEEIQVSGETLRIFTDPERSSQIVSAMTGAGVRVSEVHTMGLSLEELFLRLTEDGEER